MCLMLACKIRAIQRHVLAAESYNSAFMEAHGGLAHLHHPPQTHFGEYRGRDSSIRVELEDIQPIKDP